MPRPDMPSNNEELPNPSAQPAEPDTVLNQKKMYAPFSFLSSCRFLIFDVFSRLEDAVAAALAGFFLAKPSKSVVTDVTDPRGDFFQVYKREAEEYDKDFIKKYDEDANTTLIFVRHPQSLTSSISDF
jgi:hypothetical protein